MTKMMVAMTVKPTGEIDADFVVGAAPPGTDRDGASRASLRP